MGVINDIRTEERKYMKLSWENDELKNSIMHNKIRLRNLIEKCREKEEYVDSLIVNYRKLRGGRVYKNMTLGLNELALNIVADVFKLDPKAIKSKTRKREYVMARNCISAVIYRESYKKTSYADIGAFLGGKDHATILHGLRTHDLDLVRDKKYRLQFEVVNELILKNG